MESSDLKEKLQPTILDPKKSTDKKIEINFLNKSQARIRSLLSKANKSAVKKTQETPTTTASTTSIMSLTTTTTPATRSHFPSYLPKAMAGHFPPPHPPAAAVTNFPPPPPSSVIAAVHSMPYPSVTVPSLIPQPLSSTVSSHIGMVTSSQVPTKYVNLK